MVKEITFFKQNNKWYADIPSHTLEENEMVLGADAIINELASSDSKLTLTFSDSFLSDYYILHLKRVEHDDEGAWYEFDGPLYVDAMSVLINELGTAENKVWICNVTHDIFGEHPEELYLIDIDRS